MNGSPEAYTLATFSSRAGVIRSLVLLAFAFAAIFALSEAAVFAVGLALCGVALLLIAIRRLTRIGGLFFRLAVGLPVYGTLLGGAMITPVVGDMVILVILGVLLLGLYAFMLRDGFIELDVRKVRLSHNFDRRTISLDAIADVSKHRGIIAKVARIFGFSSSTVTLKLHAWARGRLRFLGTKKIHLNVALDQVESFLADAANLIEVEEEEEEFDLPVLGQRTS